MMVYTLTINYKYFFRGCKVVGIIMNLCNFNYLFIFENNLILIMNMI